MKITLQPTGRFETINQGSGRVECRVWEGATESGAKVIAHIPCVGLRNDASAAEHEQWARELREVATERQLVSFDLRMVV